MKQQLMGRTAAAPFAHLLSAIGLSARASKAEDDDADKKAEDEDDDKKAEDEDEDKKAEDEDADKKAEDEDDDKKAEDEDEDDKRDGKRAEDDSEYEKGRKAERARCERIFRAEAAGLRPDVAAQLAFGTNLSAKEAIGVLTATAAGGGVGKVGLSQRMTNVRVPNPGQGGGGTGNAGADKSATLAAQIVAAGKKARGEK